MSLNKLNKIWETDLLGRQADAVYLASFLRGRIQERAQRGQKAYYVLNIDAGWGGGKSFFLARLGEQYAANGSLVAHVNAWLDDHADDPLIAVMAAIEESVRPLLADAPRKKVWNAIKRNGLAIAAAAGKGAVMRLLERGIGSGVNEIAALLKEPQPDDEKDQSVTVDAIRAATEAGTRKFDAILDELATKALESFKDAKASVGRFKANLEALLTSRSQSDSSPKLIVLVDELDRCRPLYAIALLERIKHLFEVNGVVFIVATDTSQLQHSIRAVYGEGFDAPGYLRRFFDRTYRFQEPQIDALIGYQLKNAPLDASKVSVPHEVSVRVVLEKTFTFFGLSPRDIEQCHDILRTIVTVWETDEAPLELCLLLPLVIAYHRQVEVTLDVTLWDDIVKAGGPHVARKTVPQLSMKLPNHEGAVLTQSVSLKAIFLSLAKAVSHSLDRQTSDARNGGIEGWGASRFAAELERQTKRGKSRSMSIARKYPQLVAQAGRFEP